MSGEVIELDYRDRAIAALQARVHELEDCLQQFRPFAKCYEIDYSATFKCHFEGEGTLIGAEFRRDTMYFDQRAFKRVDKLLSERVIV